MYHDGLAVHRQSPIQAVTRDGIKDNVEQDQHVNHYTKPRGT